MPSKLRVGLLLDNWSVSAWAFGMIERIINDQYASVDLVILNHSKKSEVRRGLISRIRKNWKGLPFILTSRFLRVVYKKYFEGKVHDPNAFAKKDLRRDRKSVV